MSNRAWITCALLLALTASCGRSPIGEDDGGLDGAALSDGPRSGDGTALTDRGRTEAGASEAGLTLDHRLLLDGTPPPGVDLQLSGFSAAASGSSVLYSFKVCNAGQGPAGPFAVALYFNSAAPPQPKQAGDLQKPFASLGAGACAAAQLQRTGAPAGSYSSWLQVDVDNVVVESNETNNVAGPVKVSVQPPKPDLVIKQFDVQLNNPDILYEILVCNNGPVPAFVFRVDLYYNRALPPGVLQLGDVENYILSLGAGACQTIKRTYKNAPVGILNSWAFVDTLNTVAEADEGNNSAGPHLTLVAPPGDCLGLCSFAVGCGTFKLTEYPQCLTWCNSLTPAKKQCAQQAHQAKSCADLKSCKLPPPPPPPPPPWACLTLCNWVVDTCKLVPQSQRLGCTLGCLTLASTKVQCGLDAMAKKNCLQTVLCIL